MHKYKGSAIIALVVVMALAAVAAIYWGYGIYQHNKLSSQAQLASLIAEQEKIVLQQRAVHGELPEKIVAKPIERHAVVERPVMQALPAAKNFSCDGRQHCSQMRSYEEALFFNQYCPNTKMDGDGDGIPCERQFKR